MNIYESLTRRMGDQKSLHISYPDAGSVYVFKKGSDKPYFEVHVGIVGKTEDGKKVVQAIFEAIINEDGVALKEKDRGLKNLKGWKRSIMLEETDEPITLLSIEKRVTSLNTEGGSYVAKTVFKLSKSDEAVEGALGVVLPVLLSEESGQGRIVEKLAEALENVNFEEEKVTYEVGVDNYVNKFQQSSFKPAYKDRLIVQQVNGGDATFFHTNSLLYSIIGDFDGIVPAEAVRKLDEFIENIKEEENKDEKVNEFLEDFLNNCLLVKNKKSSSSLHSNEAEEVQLGKTAVNLIFH